MIHLRNTYKNYEPEEVLQIMQEWCRLSGLIDIEVDAGALLRADMSIRGWRMTLDLLEWKKLYRGLNALFKIDVPEPVWMEAVMPERERSLWDLCQFLSRHARKEVIHPVEILGRGCLTAAVFLTLRKKLSERGIDVVNIKPSTALKGFLTQQDYNSSYIVAEMSFLTGVRTFDTFKAQLRDELSFWQKLNVFSSNRYYISTGTIATFRDLSKRIAEQL